MRSFDVVKGKFFWLKRLILWEIANRINCIVAAAITMYGLDDDYGHLRMETIEICRSGIRGIRA